MYCIYANNWGILMVNVTVPYMAYMDPMGYQGGSYWFSNRSESPSQFSSPSPLFPLYLAIISIIIIIIWIWHDLTQNLKLCWLVVSTPLKNMEVSWDEIPNILWENILQTFQTHKPPTRNICPIMFHYTFQLWWLWNTTNQTKSQTLGFQTTNQYK
jgi:hypothetical protein